MSAIYYNGQQHLIFFVPRTSIGDLISSELRYVYRIFLSCMVSKIQRNLYVQN